jgi:Cu/Ag efflux pump CusA
MVNSIIEFSLRQRPFVLLASAALLLAGIWSAFHLPVDAVPDITNIQVQVNTEVPALAPEEIEKLVTFPLEIELAGVPGMTGAAVALQVRPLPGHACVQGRDRHLPGAATGQRAPAERGG